MTYSLVAIPLDELVPIPRRPDLRHRKVGAAAQSPQHEEPRLKSVRLELHAQAMRAENSAYIHMREAQREAWQRRRARASA